ncbi:unnamed protein product [Gulo gulo]|uniref:Uncharacterized protein n=1 Tax=Gulo gulo TaxID=48420 RepID=A0A9X9PZR8_GULGU|nr:unnamed protein product [Gulo gulo]
MAYVPKHKVWPRTSPQAPTPNPLYSAQVQKMANSLGGVGCTETCDFPAHAVTLLAFGRSQGFDSKMVECQGPQTAF